MKLVKENVNLDLLPHKFCNKYNCNSDENISKATKVVECSM